MSDETPEAVAAEFAATLTPADVPVGRVDHAALVVADALGAILGGSTTPYVADLAELSARTRSGTASILGTDLHTSADRAALVNGSAGSVLELDEGHKYSAGHPTMHIVPALLAEVETRTPTDGREFLTALVAGYEVGARVGMACIPLDEAYHMHGIWGTVGTAVAVARVREYDPEMTLAAMRIGANHALHTSFDAALKGATVRNTYMGMSAMNGILAADQAASGFTGLEDGLAQHLGRTTAEGFDRVAVATALGDRWEFTRGYFKIHAACRYTHGALDAIDALEADHEFDASEVESALVETYPSATRLTADRPSNDLQAKFSIPFAVATRLLRGHSNKSAFAAESLDEQTYELADAVDVTAADDLAARAPDARSTRITLHLADGRTLEEEIEHARGDEANPLSRDELRAKFETLATPVLDGTSQDLWVAATGLPETSPTDLVDLATTESP